MPRCLRWFDGFLFCFHIYLGWRYTAKSWIWSDLAGILFYFFSFFVLLYLPIYRLGWGCLAWFCLQWVAAFVLVIYHFRFCCLYRFKKEWETCSFFYILFSVKIKARFACIFFFFPLVFSSMYLWYLWHLGKLCCTISCICCWIDSRGRGEGEDLLVKGGLFLFVRNKSRRAEL